MTRKEAVFHVFSNKSAVVTPPSFISSSENEGNSTSSTHAHTVAAGSNRLLVVTIGYANVVPVSATSVTFNGIALTLAGSINRPGTWPVTKSDIWYLIAPAIGTYNVVVIFDSVGDFHVTAKNFVDVNQITPLGTFVSAVGTSITPAVTVAADANSLVVSSCACAANTTMVAGGGQTERQQGGTSNFQHAESDGINTTASWTLGVSTDWAIGAVSIKAASAGGFIRTWPDIATLPAFNWPINSGLQAITITLPRAWSKAGEEGEEASLEDLALGNLVHIFLVRDNADEEDLYRGIIEEYAITEAGVEVTLITKTSVLKDRLIDEEIVFTDTDPTDMAKYLVDNSYLPGLTWVVQNTPVGLTYNQTIKDMTVGQALEVFRRLAGSNYFYRINRDDSFVFDRWDLKDAPTWRLSSRSVASVSYVRSRLECYHHVVVYGAEIKDSNGVVIGRVRGEATKGGYDPLVSPRDLAHTDNRLTDSVTANKVAEALLEFHGEDAIETEIDVIGEQIDGFGGFQVEDFRPGDTLEVVNPLRSYEHSKWGAVNWGSDVYGTVRAGLPQGPLVIANIDYSFTGARIKLTNKPATVIEELVNVTDKIFLAESAS